MISAGFGISGDGNVVVVGGLGALRVYERRRANGDEWRSTEDLSSFVSDGRSFAVGEPDRGESGLVSVFHYCNDTSSWTL